MNKRSQTLNFSSISKNLLKGLDSLKSLDPLLVLKQLLAVACVGALLSTASYAGKLYKWVDANGNISYQDRPPPKNAKILQEREIEAPAIQPSTPAIEGVPVIVYTLDNCARCGEVLSWLSNHGIPAEERPLQQDREAQRRILDLSNGLTVPTLFIDENIIVDTSEASMLAALRQADYTILLPESPEDSNTTEAPVASENEPQAEPEPSAEDEFAELEESFEDEESDLAIDEDEDFLNFDEADEESILIEAPSVDIEQTSDQDNVFIDQYNSSDVQE